MISPLFEIYIYILQIFTFRVFNYLYQSPGKVRGKESKFYT